MANNSNLFNAALAGAVAGIASRWLTSGTSISYDAQAALMNEFATEFDAGIAPISGGGSKGQSAVVQSIAHALWRDRLLTAETDFASIVSPLIALYESVSTYILPDGSGGGGGVFPATAASVAVTDDGNLVEVIRLSYEPTTDAICVVGVQINPDNPADSPNGLILIEDPAGNTFSLDWGPIVPGDTLYQTFSCFGEQQGDYVLSAAVGIGTGAVTISQATMFVIPLP